MDLTVHITVRWETQVRRLSLTQSTEQTVHGLLQVVLREIEADLPPVGWWITHEGRALGMNQSLGEIPRESSETTITLVMQWESPMLRAMAPPEPVSSAAPDEDFDEAVVPESAPAPAPMLRRKVSTPQAMPQPAKRRATVRYYEQMNPQRMYPLLVVISKEQIAKAKKKRVQQTESEAFDVDEKRRVEIEPVLPGCHCYPPSCEVEIEKDVDVTFWVVPHVLGRLMGTRVIVRQDGRELAMLDLEVKVVRQTITVVMAVLTFLLPFLMTLMKYARLDFASQLEDGFPIYAQVANLLSQSLSPEVVGGFLLLVTFGLYLWRRPRKRDVFWDIETADPG